MTQRVATLEVEITAPTGRIINDLSTLKRATNETMGETVRANDRAATSAARFAAQQQKLVAQFGMTASEIQQYRAALQAINAEKAGRDDLAARIRGDAAALAEMTQAAAAAAAEEARLATEARAATLAQQELAKASASAAAAMDAQRIREAATAHAIFEAKVRQGVAAMKEADAAAERDAAALARLMAMLNPAGAAQERLNAELEEARRVMIAAGTSAEDLARVELLLAKGHGQAANGAGAQRQAMQNLGFQFQDFAVQVVSGGGVLRAFAQQFPQAADAMTGFGGKAKGIGDFFAGPWGIALTVAATVVAGLAMQMEQAQTKAEKEAEALRTATGAVEALDAATGRLNKTKEQQIAIGARATQQLLKEALAQRELLASRLQSVRVTDAQGFGGTSGIGGAGLVGRAVVDDVARNAAKIKEFQDSLGGIGFAKAVDAATASTNKAAAATQVYEARVASIQAAWDRSGKTARDQALVQQLVADAMRRRDAATKAASGSAVGMVNADAMLASASTDVQRAQAAVTKVRAENAVALAAHTMTQAQATARLADAQRGLYAARDAQKAHTKAVSDGAREERAAAKVANDLAEARANSLGALAAEAQKLVETWNQMADLGPNIRAPKSTTWIEDLNRFGQQMDANGPLKKLNDELDRTADLFSDIAAQATDAAANMERAFGRVGGAIGDLTETLSRYGARQNEIDARVIATEAEKQKASRDTANNQLSTTLGLISASKNLFSERSKGYKAMEAAEKALTIVQLARTAVDVAGGAARMFATLGPAGFAAVGAMVAVMAGLGFSGGGGGGSAPPVTNNGTGSVLGAPDAKSESIKNAIDLLRSVDDATLGVSRDMLNSLRSIESQIGGVASLLVRSGNIAGASAGVSTGFNSSLSGGLVGGALFGVTGLINNTIGKLPIVGGIINGVTGALKSLFGTKTSVVGSGLYAGGQSLSDILGGGFDLQTFADVQKKKKFLGISAGTKYSTQYGSADPELGDQFTLVLRSFNDAITAAAGPLGVATGDIKNRLSGFIVDLGKVDFTGLSGDEITDKLNAVFGAAADDMAAAAIPGLDRFQQVGEGAFETLVRVASTVEQVDAVFRRLGVTSGTMSVDVDMAVAGMFDSVSDFTSAANSYFEKFYTPAEQAAAKTAEMGRAFDALGLAMPDTLAGFRSLVEAQELASTAGQQTYATLLQLAPAFADLKGQLDDTTSSAKSAADILSERRDLERQILQLQGDTDAIRALDLDKLDASNRGLQLQVYALQDQASATEAATKAANDNAAAQAQIDQQRAGLQSQLWAAEGNVAAQRAAELAAIDPMLRGMQEAIYRWQDGAAAATAAAAAADALAQAEKATADQRASLQQQLWQEEGNTAAIRAAELAALDPMNRGLQEAIWRWQDGKTAAAAAASAAKELSDAWKSVGDSLMDEVRRIRGLTETASGGGYASLLSQFNAATLAARGGDQTAGGSLAGLSQSLLEAAAQQATSQQELARIQGMTAASLEETYALVTNGLFSANDNGKLAGAWTGSTAAADTTSELQQLRSAVADLTAEVKQLREENNAGNAAIIAPVSKTARILDATTGENGGNELTVRIAA